MNIAGTVKLLAVVAPDGTVKAFEPVGGSPLLVQASEDAIKRWKFAPAAAESKELIESSRKAQPWLSLPVPRVYPFAHAVQGDFSRVSAKHPCSSEGSNRGREWR